ncbi:MAG: hypothetical protein ACP5IE_00085 [Infirmifilum sp.]
MSKRLGSIRAIADTVLLSSLAKKATDKLRKIAEEVKTEIDEGRVTRYPNYRAVTAVSLLGDSLDFIAKDYVTSDPNMIKDSAMIIEKINPDFSKIIFKEGDIYKFVDEISDVKKLAMKLLEHAPKNRLFLTGILGDEFEQASESVALLCDDDDLDLIQRSIEETAKFARDIIKDIGGLRPLAYKAEDILNNLESFEALSETLFKDTDAEEIVKSYDFRRLTSYLSSWAYSLYGLVKASEALAEGPTDIVYADPDKTNNLFDSIVTVVMAGKALLSSADATGPVIPGEIRVRVRKLADKLDKWGNTFNTSNIISNIRVYIYKGDCIKFDTISPDGNPIHEDALSLADEIDSVAEDVMETIKKDFVMEGDKGRCLVDKNGADPLLRDVCKLWLKKISPYKVEQYAVISGESAAFTASDQPGFTRGCNVGVVGDGEAVEVWCDNNSSFEAGMSIAGLDCITKEIDNSGATYVCRNPRPDKLAKALSIAVKPWSHTKK